MRKKGRKGRSLVIGCLERVGSKVFDDYRAEITELVGGRPGIYALYRNNKLYYVGLARNLRSRLKQHLRDHHAGLWNYFSAYLIRAEKHLKDLESLAIRISYPKGNRTRGKFPGAPDMRKTLRRKMQQGALQEISDMFGKCGLRDSSLPGRGTAAKKAWRTRRSSTGNGAPPLSGLLSNVRIKMKYKGREYKGWVNRSGTIKISGLGVFRTPSSAAKAVKQTRSANGWFWWRYKTADGEWQKIDALRQ